MAHSPAGLLPPLFFSLCLAACSSGSTNEAPQDASVDTGVQPDSGDGVPDSAFADTGTADPTPGDDTGTGDGGTCIVLAETFDRTCTQDSDCVAVPAGGNLCDPCANGTGCLQCKLVALSATGNVTYGKAIAAAGGLPSPLLADGGINQCAIASCPAGLTPTCQAGLCTTSNDAGTASQSGLEFACSCAAQGGCGDAGGK